MKRVFAALLVLIIAAPSLAWNYTGHKAIGIIAYSLLTPATKTRVDSLLARHPDYPKWTAGVGASDRGRAAFLEAAIWPDEIRNDPRFHNDNQRPTSDIPGLPPGSQARHSGWHYMNIPFSTDGTPTRPTAEPNILTKLKDFEALAAMSEAQKVYVLPWLLHLIGDIHQPLHTMQRFDRIRPTGDRGGNEVDLKTTDLHAYWDSRIGTGDTERFLNQLASTIQSRHPKPTTLDMELEHSWKLARPHTLALL